MWTFLHYVSCCYLFRKTQVVWISVLCAYHHNMSFHCHYLHGDAGGACPVTPYRYLGVRGYGSESLYLTSPSSVCFIRYKQNYVRAETVADVNSLWYCFCQRSGATAPLPRSSSGRVVSSLSGMSGVGRTGTNVFHLYAWFCLWSITWHQVPQVLKATWLNSQLFFSNTGESGQSYYMTWICMKMLIK
jgi:hypothetical protein